MRRLASGAPGRAALALLSGLGTWLAFPPAGLWPLAPLGAAGLMLAVHGARARRGAWLGLGYGLGLFLPLLSWMAVTGVDALILLALLEAGGLLLTGAALAAVSRTRGWPLWSALLWVAGELVRANVPFGGFPWGRLAFATAGSPYAHYAALGGVALVSAAVALSAGLITRGCVQLIASGHIGVRRAGLAAGQRAPIGRHQLRHLGRVPAQHSDWRVGL